MVRRASVFCVLALSVISVAIAADARGQDGQPAQGYSGYAPSTPDQPQLVAAGQSKAVESLPPDYGALPPSDGPTTSELAKRIAALEKQLADSAKSASAAKLQTPPKPLCVPTGRIQFDMANFTQNDASMNQYGDIPNAVGFRRARIALMGEYEVIDYIIEMDFANRGGLNTTVNQKDQSTGFKDVYGQVRDLPLIGNVRIGHFKECFGLEQLTSDNYTTFMERSMIDEGAFVPGRNNGIMAFNWTENQRATGAIGVYTNQTSYDQPPLFQYDHWGLDMSMRATYLPWYDEASNGRGLLHTGLDYAYRTGPDYQGKFTARPECNFVPSSCIINLSLSDVKEWQVAGAETALVYGPLSMQSEVYGMTVNRQNNVSNNFYGAYAFVSYFLTGENRPYNRKLGVFDRVRPLENFFRVRTCDDNVATGCGAWEVAYRFSYIDLLDGLTTQGAGQAADHTIGVNWYWNPFTRVMFNYVHSQDVSNTLVGANVQRISGGSLDIFETRFAIDF